MLSWAVDFVVGDDPRVAVGIALALAVSGVAVRMGSNPWWIVLVAVPLVVGWSLLRATQKRPSDDDPDDCALARPRSEAPV